MWYCDICISPARKSECLELCRGYFNKAMATPCLCKFYPLYASVTVDIAIFLVCNICSKVHQRWIYFNIHIRTHLKYWSVSKKFPSLSIFTNNIAFNTPKIMKYYIANISIFLYVKCSKIDIYSPFNANIDFKQISSCV